MSAESIVLSLDERTVAGKAVKQLRRDGLLPAVIHDHGKASIMVVAPYTEVWKVYQRAGKHHPVELTVDKKKFTVIIKDVDFEPKKQLMRHVVFNAIKADEKVETEVPVHLVGEIPAEKTGLLIIRQLDHVEIEALPKDLVDSVEVDATSLVEIGDRIFVSDIKVPAGVTILTEAEHPIAAVEESKAQMSEEEAAGEETAAEVPSEHGSAEADEDAKSE